MAGIDFDDSVIARSERVPVLVDFWAPWCAPCRILGPVLEDLARHAQGRFELAKVDIDEQPELAELYGIESIPAVKLFRHGQVLAEFVGALGRAEVEQWLATHLPDPDQAQLAAIVARWPARGTEVVPELEAFAAAHPGLGSARLRLAQALSAHDPTRARALLEGVEADGDTLELLEDVTSLLDLMEPADAVPARLAPHLAGARAAFARHDLAALLGHLVDAAGTDREYGDELARRAAVALFRWLGHEHELTRTHQRRLAMVLHS